MRSLADVARIHGITDRRLLRAMRQMSRSRFVPPELVHLANQDVPLPIGRDQVTTQPSLVASMVQALALEGNDIVLEVGTGYGYQTALLARLARHVWSVERWPDLAERARENLAAAGITNVDVVTGDGSRGLPDRAPFDAIMVAAAFPQVPPPLVDQLAQGGRLVQPIGPGGAEKVTLFLVDGPSLKRVRVVTEGFFVPLVGAHGFDAP
jgi:protein-L-isoaspartate(D-aspartate) O-methyltransferase